MRRDRRQVAQGLAAIALAPGALLAQPARPSQPGGRIDPDRVGVNTMLSQGQPPARVRDALRFLGIRHIRDGMPNEALLPRYAQVLRDPVRLTVRVGAARPLAVNIATLERLERNRPGTLAAIEGPNEINNFRFDYTALSGLPAALAFQQDLFRAVKASPVLAHLPVISFTNVGYQDSASDFANFHPYPQHGQPLSNRLALILARVKSSPSPNKPVQFTEFGYSTAEVSEEQQATLLVDGLREAIAAGIRRTFVYQLADFYRDHDPSQPRLANHFGLFDLNYRPKQAAEALASLLHG